MNFYHFPILVRESELARCQTLFPINLDKLLSQEASRWVQSDIVLLGLQWFEKNNSLFKGFEVTYVFEFIYDLSFM